jgi:hypothetical protein
VLQAYRRRSEPSGGRPTRPGRPIPPRVSPYARPRIPPLGVSLVLLRRRLCPQISLYIGRYRTGRTAQALLHSVSSIRWQNSASYTPLTARPIPPWDGDALYPPRYSAQVPHVASGHYMATAAKFTRRHRVVSAARRHYSTASILPCRGTCASWPNTAFIAAMLSASISEAPHTDRPMARRADAAPSPSIWGCGLAVSPHRPAAPVSPGTAVVGSGRARARGGARHSGPPSGRRIPHGRPRARRLPSAMQAHRRLPAPSPLRRRSGRPGCNATA